MGRINLNGYDFDPETAYRIIRGHWLQFAGSTGIYKFVLGISGGKDSTVCAKLAADIFKPENVYGVMMPNGEQKDIADAEAVFEVTRINKLTINIGKAYEEMIDGIAYSGINEGISADTKINLPPRLRMAALYGVAQSVGGLVLNTDNAAEIGVGYYTIFGDGAGSYGPLRELTVGEVVALGDWLGLPKELTHKKPGDGLQEQGDEDRLGIKYSDLDRLIRTGHGNKAVIDKVCNMYRKNRFKMDIVNIPCPNMGYKNFLLTGKIIPDDVTEVEY